MGLKPKSVRTAINALAKKLLEHPSTKIRVKAAQSLSEFGSDQALEYLCQALNQEEDENVQMEIMNAMMSIIKLTSSLPMSEAPKYDFRGSNIGNFADNVQGDQKAVQHNYAQQQNLTEAAKEIQDLIQYLQQTNPTTTEEEAVKQVIKNNPTLKTRLINAVKQGGTEALKVFFPFVSIPLETIRGFIEAE